MTSNSAYTMNVLQELYDSLLIQDPSGNDLLWLAETYIAETHDDNPSVPDGYTRFTIDMIQNATWTDGTPLTAEDVAYSLNYFRDSPGNPYGTDLVEMTAAYAPSTFRVVVDFSSESFWHLHSLGYKYIIPKHIFLTIGLENWNIWDPNPPAEEMVTSGPFNVSDYAAGEFCELSKNPDYFYGIDESSYVTTTTTTTTPTTSTIPTYSPTTSVTTTTTTSTTSPTVPIEHGLYWGVSIGDRLDFEVTNTLVDAMVTIYSEDSGNAYFLVTNTPTIPETISSIYDVPYIDGTIWWENGTEWNYLESPIAPGAFVVPLGNVDLYIEAWSEMAYTTNENSQVFGYTMTIEGTTGTLEFHALYSKNSGFLSLYSIRIFDTASLLLGEFRIDVIVETSSSTTSPTATPSSSWLNTLLANLGLIITIGSVVIIIIVGGLIIRSTRG